MTTAEILNTTGSYSDADIELFAAQASFRQVSRNEYLLQPGKICSTVFFAITGSFYQYNIKNDIDENIIDLHVGGEWFFNQPSFVAQKPSDCFIKAYTDSTILQLDIRALHFLIGRSAAFLQLARLFEHGAARTHFFDQALSPALRYQYVLTHHPQLLQTFPLRFIAAYLKMAPETLSRVRDQLAKGKIAF